MNLDRAAENYWGGLQGVTPADFVKFARNCTAASSSGLPAAVQFQKQRLNSNTTVPSAGTGLKNVPFSRNSPPKPPMPNGKHLARPAAASQYAPGSQQQLLAAGCQLPGEAAGKKRRGPHADRASVMSCSSTSIGPGFQWIERRVKIKQPDGKSKKVWVDRWRRGATGEERDAEGTITTKPDADLVWSDDENSGWEFYLQAATERAATCAGPESNWRPDSGWNWEYARGKLHPIAFQRAGVAPPKRHLCAKEEKAASTPKDKDVTAGHTVGHDNALPSAAASAAAVDVRSERRFSSVAAVNAALEALGGGAAADNSPEPTPALLPRAYCLR